MKKNIALFFVFSVLLSFVACKKEPPAPAPDPTPKEFPKPLVDAKSYKDEFAIVKGDLNRTIFVDFKKDFKALEAVEAKYLNYIKKVDLTNNKSYIKLTIDEEKIEDLSKINSIELKLEGKDNVSYKLESIENTEYASNEALTFLSESLQESYSKGKATVKVLINGKEDADAKVTITLHYDVKIYFGK